MKNLTLNDYQDLAGATLLRREKGRDLLAYLIFGLMEETGEVAARLKHMMSGGRKVPSSPDRGSLLLELGDVLWYLATLSAALDLNLEEIAAANLRKLRIWKHPEAR